MDQIYKYMSRINSEKVRYTHLTLLSIIQANKYIHFLQISSFLVPNICFPPPNLFPSSYVSI